MRFEISELLVHFTGQRFFAFLVLREQSTPRLILLVCVGERVQFILRVKGVEPPDFIVRAGERLEREVWMRAFQLARLQCGLRLDAIILCVRTRLQRFASYQQDSWRRLWFCRNVHKEWNCGRGGRGQDDKDSNHGTSQNTVWRQFSQSASRILRVRMQGTSE